MLLQANDFRWLYEHHDVELQIGGSDQWGNITAGIDLIRRTLGRRCPRPHLAAAHPARRHQDGQVGRRSRLARSGQDDARTSSASSGCRPPTTRSAGYLRRLSLRPLGRDRRAAGRARGGARAPAGAQRALAEELTALVHGREAAGAAEEAAGVLFGGDPLAASPEGFAVVRREVGATDRPRRRAGRPCRACWPAPRWPARTAMPGAHSRSVGSGPTGRSSTADEGVALGRAAPHRGPVPAAAQGQDQLPRGGMCRTEVDGGGCRR